ncbi:MAG: C39 family peptidase [Bryobacterales bacterium]|nr:C39 family peptidase [Bryobacterales bacterium]
MPLFVAIFLWVAALAPLPVASAIPTDEVGLRLEVPFTPQVKEGCGSAAIAMVMQWWKQHGHEPADAAALDVLAIHKAVYSPKAKGTPAVEMERYFERAGFRAYAFNGEWIDLTEHLGKGRPLIVALRPRGQRQLHYVVLSGVSAAEVLLHDPATKPFRVMLRAEFEAQWTASGRWTLLALPRP